LFTTRRTFPWLSGHDRARRPRHGPAWDSHGRPGRWRGCEDGMRVRHASTGPGAVSGMTLSGSPSATAPTTPRRLACSSRSRSPTGSVFRCGVLHAARVRMRAGGHCGRGPRGRDRAALLRSGRPRGAACPLRTGFRGECYEVGAPVWQHCSWNGAAQNGPPDLRVSLADAPSVPGTAGQITLSRTTRAAMPTLLVPSRRLPRAPLAVAGVGSEARTGRPTSGLCAGCPGTPHVKGSRREQPPGWPARGH
jgi:hypothetical protein